MIATSNLFHSTYGVRFPCVTTVPSVIAAIINWVWGSFASLISIFDALHQSW